MARRYLRLLLAIAVIAGVTGAWSASTTADLDSAVSELERRLADPNAGAGQLQDGMALFSLAESLFEQGRKDDAVYWFYFAQLRTKSYLSRFQDGQGLAQRRALSAVLGTLGPTVNAYAFGDLGKLVATLRRVLEQDAALPNHLDPPPDRAIAEQRWAAKHAEVRAGLQGLIEHIRTNQRLIQQQRSENGLTTKLIPR